jgi:hypothetical protein
MHCRLHSTCSVDQHFGHRRAHSSLAWFQQARKHAAHIRVPGLHVPADSARLGVANVRRVPCTWLHLFTSPFHFHARHTCPVVSGTFATMRGLVWTKAVPLCSPGRAAASTGIDKCHTRRWPQHMNPATPAAASSARLWTQHALLSAPAAASTGRQGTLTRQRKRQDTRSSSSLTSSHLVTATSTSSLQTGSRVTRATCASKSAHVSNMQLMC